MRCIGTITACLCTVLLFTLCCFSPTLVAQTDNNWTILYYAAGSNSSEQDLMPDVDEMLRGKTADGYELVLLIDRIDGFADDSTTLGANFDDTRLYHIDKKGYVQLDGKEELPEISRNGHYEGNMGDADLLRRFIRYGKKHYPAKHYMLIIRSHGNGLGMCPDREKEVTIGSTQESLAMY
jgi:clostripain